MENFRPPDLQREYGKTVRAARILATAAILFSGASCWCRWNTAGSSYQLWSSLHEPMVGPGRLPALAEVVFSNQVTMAAWTLFAGVAFLLLLWLKAKRLSSILYCALGGTLPFLAFGEGLQMAGSSLLFEICNLQFKG